MSEAGRCLRARERRTAKLMLRLEHECDSVKCVRSGAARLVEGFASENSDQFLPVGKIGLAVDSSTCRSLADLIVSAKSPTPRRL